MHAEDATSTVDDLEGQLSKLQQAMDQLQQGDLDAAEASISELEDTRELARGLAEVDAGDEPLVPSADVLAGAVALHEQE